MADVRSVRALLEEKSSNEAWVAGRIALIEPHAAAAESPVCDRNLRAVLEHDGARVTLICERLDARDVRLGTWVRARGRLLEGVFEADVVDVLHQPEREPTAASCDAVWGQRGGLAMLHQRSAALAAARAWLAAEGF